MDSGSALIVALIVVGGGFEYYRRERNHRAMLASLERGQWVPLQARSPAVWRLLGEGLVAILLAAASALMFYAGLRGTPSRTVLYGMGTLFCAMMVIVALMLVRDARQRRQSSSASLGEKP